MGGEVPEPLPRPPPHGFPENIFTVEYFLFFALYLFLTNTEPQLLAKTDSKYLLGFLR
jgi:hypothetical protein